MTSSALELQKAVFAVLNADPALTGLLGENAIHDHAPAHLAFPYVTFGRTSAFDWSTGTEDGSEHLFTLHVWSKAKGKSQAMEIVDAIHRVLHDAQLAMTGHRLVNLREEFQEVRYDEDQAVHHGVVRYRAVTEAVA